MDFYATLIKVIHLEDDRGCESLDTNCTHVIGDYYIMEGDIDCLRDDGVHLQEIYEDGIVPCLGGLSKDELVEICKNSFNFDCKTGKII